MDKQTVSKSDKTQLKANTFTRDNYKFAGWATEQTCEKTYDDEVAVTFTEAKILYAVWTPDTSKWGVIEGVSENPDGTKEEKAYQISTADG